jgi:hypothetical protein
MKKIITLMGTVLLVTSSFAQYHPDNQKSYDDERAVTYNDRRFDKDHNDRRDDRYNFRNRERDMQVAQINREYDRKIESVRHKWFLSRSKKEAIICSLDDKRRYEIKKVYEKFNRRHNHFDDNDSKNHW